MADVMDQTPAEVFLTAFHRKKAALEMAKRTAYFTAALGGYRDVKAFDTHFPEETPARPRKSGGKAIGQFLAGKGKGARRPTKR
jgi:hypothetical protein